MSSSIRESFASFKCHGEFEALLGFTEMAEVLTHMRASSSDASPVLLRFLGACQCDGELNWRV